LVSFCFKPTRDDFTGGRIAPDHADGEDEAARDHPLAVRSNRRWGGLRA
jgi:hypothetical protein